jgi:hypothetical protein
VHDFVIGGDVVVISLERKYLQWYPVNTLICYSLAEFCELFELKIRYCSVLTSLRAALMPRRPGPIALDLLDVEPPGYHGLTSRSDKGIISQILVYCKGMSVNCNYRACYYKGEIIFICASRQTGH